SDGISVRCASCSTEPFTVHFGDGVAGLEAAPGVAAQHADAAAEAIAALADLADAPEPCGPVIHRLLLTSGKRALSAAQVTDGHGSSSEVTHAPTCPPGTKLAAKQLALYLEERNRLAVSTT